MNTAYESPVYIGTLNRNSAGLSPPIRYFRKTKQTLVFVSRLLVIVYGFISAKS